MCPDTHASRHRKWAEFHKRNPHVYDLLREYSLQLKRAGHERIGIRMVWERMRWDYAIETASQEFKLNDHYTRFYARLLMLQEPDLDRMFETRDGGTNTE